MSTPAAVPPASRRREVARALEALRTVGERPRPPEHLDRAARGRFDPSLAVPPGAPGKTRAAGGRSRAGEHAASGAEQR